MLELFCLRVLTQASTRSLGHLCGAANGCRDRGRRWTGYLRRLDDSDGKIGAGEIHSLDLGWRNSRFNICLLFPAFVLTYVLRRLCSLMWWVFDPDAFRVIRRAGLYALVGAGMEVLFQSERSARRYASMRGACCCLYATSVGSR